jgi:transcriptional regulator with XRE-family HTH domain
MELSEKIKLIRKTLRMSQKEFASEINCSQSIISAYELGIKKPSYDILIVLGVLIKKYKIKVSLL